MGGQSVKVMQTTIFAAVTALRDRQREVLRQPSGATHHCGVRIRVAVPKQNLAHRSCVALLFLRNCWLLRAIKQLRDCQGKQLRNIFGPP